MGYIINQKQVLILHYLSIFKYLSRKQLAKLGVEFYNSNYSSLTKRLLETKHIGLQDASSQKLGHIYYLKTKGARVIAEHLHTWLETLNFVKSIPYNSNSYLEHRTFAIDCQIELFLTTLKLEIEIDFYDRDIETIGSIKKNRNLERKTRIPIKNGYLEPDGIFRLNTPRGNKLFTLELENKTFTKSSFQKVQKHIRALSSRAVSKKYEHEKSWRNLFVYVNPSIMKSVMKKAKEIQGIKNWFLFKLYDDVKTTVNLSFGKFSVEEEKDFFDWWVNANGEQVDFFWK